MKKSYKEYNIFIVGRPKSVVISVVLYIVYNIITEGTTV